MASYVDWGGEAYSPPGTIKPQMGFGTVLVGNSLSDAFMRRLTVINADGQTMDASNTEGHSSNILFYEVQDKPKGNDVFRHWLMYGGPGHIG